MVLEVGKKLYEKTAEALISLGLTQMRGTCPFELTFKSQKPVEPKELRELLQKVIQETGLTFEVRDNTSTMLSGPIRLNGTLFATLTVSNFTTSCEDLFVTFVIHAIE